MTVPILSFDHVDFAYRAGRPVLTDLSLTIAPGESVGLVEESGAGKSTLPQLALGLRAPSSGTVCLEETPLPTRRGLCAASGGRFSQSIKTRSPRSTRA